MCYNLQKIFFFQVKNIPLILFKNIIEAQKHELNIHKYQFFLGKKLMDQVSKSYDRRIFVHDNGSRKMDTYQKGG